MFCKYCGKDTEKRYCSAKCEFFYYHHSKASKKEYTLVRWMKLNHKLQEEMEKPLISKKFKSRSSNKEYHAGLYETFEECDCPGFEHRKKCVHIEELKKIHELEL